MTGIALVYAVYPDGDAARAAADLAVGQRLAACANILAPCQSVYRWDGAVTRAQEVPVLFKTSAGQQDALIAALAQAHPYDVPALVGWPLTAAHAPFAEWIATETGAP